MATIRASAMSSLCEGLRSAALASDAALSQRRAVSLATSLASTSGVACRLSSSFDPLRTQPLLPRQSRRSLLVRNVAHPAEAESRPAEPTAKDLPPFSSPSETFDLPTSSASAAEVTGGTRIWLSDVVATRKRPYFFNREWTSKDLTYLGYMLLMHGLCLFAPATFSWDALGVFFLLYVVTGMFGITLSFHRHLSHKSFVLPKWLEYTFAYCGVLAVQGSPMEWVSAHRFHHRYCDTDEDPHTPYEGFWHSHMGWLLDDKTTSERIGVRSNISDMQNDPFYNFIETTYTWHIAGMALALYALGGFPYIVWGLAVRAVWVYHITWAVNSASHVWGYQSWNTGDLSRNNWWVALLAFGEGWHNNHHAFEYSARHGLEWWQFDPTWYTVKLLEAVGLAKKVRYPTPEHRARLAFPSEASQGN